MQFDKLNGFFEKNRIFKSFCIVSLLYLLIIPVFAQQNNTDQGTIEKNQVEKAISSEAEIKGEESATTAEKKEEKKKKKKLESKLIYDMIFKLIGGLGIFLLGMKYMSDGLQTIAGSSLKRLIKAVTDNRFMACGVGVVMTLLVQSSSVTTVMAVGFVNSTIMELNQAIGIILGANIGTTITGWVLFLKIGKWGLPILGVAAFLYLFNKREFVKYLAMAVMGIGMVFFGLELMKNGFKPIKEVQAFEQAFMYFDASTYVGVLKCALVGCVLTVIVQSSSATLGITIALAVTGAIRFETAAALVLGENIGTTITAFLASIGSTANAKRAAYFHIFFNVMGVIWITALFAPYLQVIHWVMDTFMGISDVNTVKMVDGKESYIYVTGAIAMVHSVFNVTNVLIFLPFTGHAAKLLNKYVKVSDADTKDKDGAYLTQLDFQMHDSAFAALEQSSFEVKKMRDKTREMFGDLEKYLTKPKKKKFATRIFNREDTLDTVQAEITRFLTEVLAGTLSLEQTENAKKQILLADEYESISDYIMQLLKYYMRLEDNGLTLSPEQKKEIADIHQKVLEFFDKANEKSTESDEVFLEEVMKQNESLTALIKSYRANHWDRISAEKMPPLLSTSYTDIINAYRKIKNILIHVTEYRSNTQAK